MIKRLCVSIYSVPKFPTYSAKTSQKTNTGKSMLSTVISNRHGIQHRSNRHQVGFHKILHRIRGDAIAGPAPIGAIPYEPCRYISWTFEVGKKNAYKWWRLVQPTWYTTLLCAKIWWIFFASPQNKWQVFGLMFFLFEMLTFKQKGFIILLGWL